MEREKKFFRKRHHKELEESSITSSTRDLKIETEKKESTGTKQNQDLKTLCVKINEFMIAKDQEKNVIENMKERLKQSEDEVIELRKKLREKDEHFLRKQYEDNIRNLNNVIGSQNEKILQQSTELHKMKDILQVVTQANNVERSNEKKSNTLVEESGKTNNLIGDFLENIKSKMTNLENAEMLIDDDFEELSVSSIAYKEA